MSTVINILAIAASEDFSWAWNHDFWPAKLAICPRND